MRICGKLGIRLSHSRPYRPQGRGKIERFFRYVDTSFKHEAYAEVEKGRITSLADLNGAWAAWVDGFYHERTHGSTKQSPRMRAAASTREMRRKTHVELTEIFLWEETRKVDKTGCISLDGNAYEVDLELSGQRILLRYDPFDLSHIQVWLEEKRWADATVMDLTRSYDRRVTPDKPNLVMEPDGQLSFLELAERRRQAAWTHEGIAYANPEGGAGK